MLPFYLELTTNAQVFSWLWYIFSMLTPEILCRHLTLANSLTMLRRRDKETQWRKEVGR